MKRANTVVVALVALWVGSGSTLATEVTLDRYVALSIERLELAEQSWSATKQPPAPEAMATLFALYGLSETEYLAYTSANREAIDAYLAAHPESKQRIEDVKARIEQAIKDEPK